MESLLFAPVSGALLYDLARVLAPKVGYLGELHHLAYDEHAWRLAAQIDERGVAAGELLPEPKSDIVTLREALERLRLSPHQLGTSFRATFPARTWNRRLDKSSRERLRVLLTTDTVAIAELARSARAEHDKMQVYLRELNGSPPPLLGVVDMGTDSPLWGAVSAVLRTIDQPAPTVFSFGLAQPIRKTSRRLLPIARKPKTRLDYLSTPGLLPFLESVCAATQPMPIDLSTGTDMGTPPSVARLALNDGCGRVIHETICLVAKDLEYEPAIMDSNDVRWSLVEAFELFRDSPSRAEARAWWGNTSECDGGTLMTSNLAVGALITSLSRRLWSLS